MTKDAKRKAAGDTATKPAKKAKLTTPPAHTERELRSKSKTPAKANGRDVTPVVPNVTADTAPNPTGEHVWELMGGDSRDRLLVGVVAPERLTLRFRNRSTGKVAAPPYTKTAAEIDWNNKDHIDKINKWRNQVFTRDFGFPPLVARIGWLPSEEAYLELMYEKLLLIFHSDSTKALPHNSKIVEVFHEFFDGRDDINDKKGIVQPPLESRTAESITSFIRRKTKGVYKLSVQVKDRQTDKSDNAQVPSITDAEIDAYMLNKTVVADGATPALPAAGARKGKKPAVAATTTKKPAAATTSLKKTAVSTTLAKKTATRPTTKAKPTKTKTSEIIPESLANREEVDVNMLDPPPRDQPDHDLPDPGEQEVMASNLLPTPVNGPVSEADNQAISKSIERPTSKPAGQSVPNRIEQSESKGAQQLLSNTSKPTRATSSEATALATSSTALKTKPTVPRFKTSRERAVKVTTPEEFAKLAEEGWDFPDWPETDEEALRRHNESMKQTADDTWLAPTAAALHSRFNKHAVAVDTYYKRNGQREVWYRDELSASEMLVPRNLMIDSEGPYEDRDRASRRQPHAAAVNSLMNAAIIPPFGYQGNLKDLVTKRLLSDGELAAADASAAAIKTYGEMHDRAYDVYVKNMSDFLDEQNRLEKEGEAGGTDDAVVDWRGFSRGLTGD